MTDRDDRLPPPDQTAAAMIEALEEIWQRGGAVQDAEGFMTTEDMVAVSGLTHERLRRMLKAGVTRGIVERRKIPRENLAGTMVRVAAYRLSHGGDA